MAARSASAYIRSRSAPLLTHRPDIAVVTDALSYPSSHMQRVMGFRLIRTLAVLIVGSAELPAQPALGSELPVGERVRVRSRPQGSSGAEETIGALLRVQSESLFVLTDRGRSERAVAMTDVQRLWVSRGKTGRATAHGVMFGALAGGLALGAAIAYAETECADTGDSFCLGVGPGFLVGFGIGAFGGALIGGIAGTFIRAEGWKRLR
jgi:hypothetical protein